MLVFADNPLYESELKQRPTSAPVHEFSVMTVASGMPLPIRNDSAFGFKGGRDYVHGTDMFNCLEEMIADGLDSKAWITRLIIRNMARTQCAIVIGEKPPAGMAANVTFSVSNGGEILPGYLYETGDPVIDNIPYDEDGIVQTASIADDTIIQKTKSQYSPIEEIVALKKALSYRLFPDPDGKWVFMRLDLSTPLRDVANSLYSIRLSKILGKRATISDILVDNEPVGQIHFGVFKA